MAQKPGVGFRIRPGALSHIEASGGSDKRTIPFNLSADMYNVEGTRILSDNEQARLQKLKRYMGGDERFWNYVPQGGYGEEGRVQVYETLEAMYNAWKSGVDVNSDGKSAWYFEGSPADHTGTPNHREETDYSYAVDAQEADRLHSKYREYIPADRRPGEGTGTQPRREKPPRREPNTVPPPSNPLPPSIPPTGGSSSDIESLLSKVDTLSRAIIALGGRVQELTERIDAESKEQDVKFRTLLSRTRTLIDRSKSSKGGGSID